MVSFVRQEHGLSERHACSALEISRSVNRYVPKPRKDGVVIEKLMGLADRHPDLGFGKLFKIIRRHGHPWNHKRVYRIYCAMKLNKRRRGKKRLPNRHPLPLAVSAVMNGCWSIDFTSDALWCGRRFRTFNVLDDFNREALAIEVDLNLPAERVIRTLERIAAGADIRSYRRRTTAFSLAREFTGISCLCGTTARKKASTIRGECPVKTHQFI